MFDNSWHPIECAPRNRPIIVYCPAIYKPNGEIDFPELVCLCKYHESAGFCVHEIQEPTHWMEFIPPRYQNYE